MSDKGFREKFNQEYQNLCISEMKKKNMKCACGRIATYHEHLKFNSYGIDGWVCKNCGETFYNPEKAEKILLLNKTTLPKTLTDDKG